MVLPPAGLEYCDRLMAVILCLDVDGAPFLAAEMLALVERGHDVVFAGCRTIPEALVSGEWEPLRKREVRVRWLGAEAIAGFGHFLRRPARLARTLGAALWGHRRDPGALAKLAATLGWTLALARLAEDRGVTHVHGNWAHLPATSAWIVSRLTGARFSFSGHAGRDLFRTVAFLDRKLRDAAFVAVCNRAAAEQLAPIAPETAEKVRIRPHGVDLDRFRARAEGEGREGLLLSVGNLDPAKGFDVALEALALLRREGRAARWRLVGEGPERARLERRVAELGLAGAVELAGRRNGEALVEEYRAATVFLAPSRLLANGGRDGLPNVVLEAMAVGVPVVASGVAAIPEAVEDGVTGRLVPPQDPPALAAAIAALLDDPAERRRLAAAARRRVERDFDRRRALEAFCELFAGEASSEKGGARRVV